MLILHILSNPQRVKKYLHIVLTMSPAGNKFRHRCRMNPSLINCCTIDWFNEWGREACLSVAQVYFQNADFICEDDQDLKVGIRARFLRMSSL